MWRPTEEGDTLVGYYAGRTLKNGQYGQYEIALVTVPQDGVWMVTGTKILQLLDAGGVTPGTPIKIVFQGYVQLRGDREMKSFELHKDEGAHLVIEELPVISEGE